MPVLSTATSGTATSAPTMPASTTPAAIADDHRERVDRHRPAHDQRLQHVALELLHQRSPRPSTSSAFTGSRWSTSATSTATAPDRVAPTIGTNAPRNTSAASGNANGTPQDHQRQADADRVDERHQHGGPHVRDQRGPGRLARRRPPGPAAASGQQPHQEAPDPPAVAQEEERREEHQQRAGEHLEHGGRGGRRSSLVSDCGVVVRASPRRPSIAWSSWSSDRCSGPVLQPVLDLPDALAGVLGSAPAAPSTNWLITSGQRADDRGQPADQHHGGGQRARHPSAQQQPHGRAPAAPRAAARSASGITTMRRLPISSHQVAQPSTPSTSSRHAQAAAMRSAVRHVGVVAADRRRVGDRIGSAAAAPAVRAVAVAGSSPSPLGSAGAARRAAARRAHVLEPAARPAAGSSRTPAREAASPGQLRPSLTSCAR